MEFSSLLVRQVPVEDRRFWIRCSSLLSQDRHGSHRTYRVPDEAEDVDVFSMGKSGFRSFDVD